MQHALRILGILTIVATVAATRSAAQSFAVDAGLAKRGESLFRNKGCEACHSIGKGKRAGPDLQGVVERREVDWLRRWLKNTSEMLATDSTAQAMLAEYNGVKMPNLKLTDPDVEALIHYMAQAPRR